MTDTLTKSSKKYSPPGPLTIPEDGLFRVSDSPMYVLMTAERLHRANADRILREFDLDHRMWRMMIQLVEHRKRSIQDIANSTGFDRTTMSKIVDRAEKLELVARVTDARDRRRNTVSLTRKGWATIRKCGPKMAELVNSYFGDFEDGEYEAMIRLIRKMRRNVQIQNAGLEHLIDFY